MISQTFEIKVALLGYVSVGKTTVLNALLQDKFSEVSMRRTTAGVNFFRVSSQSNDKNSSEKVDYKASDSADYVEEWSMLAENPKTAESVLEEITADNSELRKTNKIQEKIFDIKLDEPLCEMRKDTKLTIVDVPGLNEAGTKAMYKQYVGDKWETFDCVVVVMDAEKGVNTEEQVELLNFVKDNLEKKKRVPVIVLCNKVDDPEDAELMQLVQEMSEQIEKIFEVGDRSQALQQILGVSNDGSNDGRGEANETYPIFIPLSAGNAFSYRTASRLNLEEFKKLDIKLIDKLGRDEVGNFKWKKLSLDAKYDTVYQAVSDTERYQERLGATNFDKFLSAFSICLGGDNVQRDLLDKQLTFALRSVSLDTLVASQLRSIHERSKAINKPTLELKASFWALYQQRAENALSAFYHDMDTKGLSKALEELVEYSALTEELGWVDECKVIHSKMENLLHRQLVIVLAKANNWTAERCHLALTLTGSIFVWNEIEECWIAVKGNRDIFQVSSKIEDPFDSPPFHYPWHWERTEPDAWKNKYTGATSTGEHPDLGKPGWKNMSPVDFSTIISMVLLASSNKHFYSRFGREKMLLERHLHTFNSYFDPSSQYHLQTDKNVHSAILRFLEGNYANGVFAPTFPDIYETVARLEAPKRLTDPNHWGNTFWMYCEFIESQK
jgi:small GTP-binding protein